MRNILILTVTLSLATILNAGTTVPTSHPTQPGFTPRYGANDFYPSAEHPVGFRGDGTGIYPGANPPIEFSDGTVFTAPRKDKTTPYNLPAGAKIKNIRWKVEVPNWSNSSPIIVGKRVFLLSEPVDYAPQLLCYDADTGKQLWVRDVDHLETFAEPERIRLRELWRKYRLKAADCAELSYESRVLWDVKKVGNDNDPDFIKRWDTFAARAKAIGLTSYIDAPPAMKWHTGAKVLTDIEAKEYMQLKTKGILNKGSNWDCGFDGSGKHFTGVYVGNTYCTPITDGTCVYVWVNSNTMTAYDLEGNKRWMTWLEEDAATIRARIRTEWTQSPVLVDGSLLVSTAPMMTCLAADTGKVRWKTRIPFMVQEGDRSKGYRWIGDPCAFQPQVIDLGTHKVVLAIDGQIYSLADGKPVCDLYDKTRMRDVATGSHAVGNRVFIPIETLDCPPASRHNWVWRGIELSNEGSGVVAKTLWTQESGKDLLRKTVWGHGGVLWNDKLYSIGGSGIIAVSAVTGKVEATAPSTGFDIVNGMVVAGGRFYLLRGDSKYDSAVITVLDKDLKELSRNYLTSGPRSPERERMIIRQAGYNYWEDCCGGPFHAGIVPHGNRLYIRSRDDLFCLENN